MARILPSHRYTEAVKDKPQDPHRLDMRSFARDGGALSGELALAGLARLASSCEAALADEPLPAVSWSARGELREPAGGRSQMWLHLQANARVRLQCQRCLLPMHEALSAQRSFLFVNDEAEAARLDEEMEDDVLVLARSLDLAELIEDELILALPLVPRHASCAPPLGAAAAEALPEEKRPNPFAALAALRRPPGGKG
jgi:uncharacterized protein